MTYKRKLIEVALPLEAVNKESAREKSIRHGHPSTLHLWWARRPLAACRAVLFASLVDDPSAHPERFPTVKDQERERKRLFSMIERLVRWENSANEQVLAEARAEIMKSTDGMPPAILDPFCGGGSIPLEAQRLGLDAHGSDLNPVAVLITKALIEIPPKFAQRPPVNPETRSDLQTGGWKGASGLAEDVRYYGNWIRDEAFRRVGHLYPKAKLSEGGDATVIAWIWARTVKCPNPGCGAQMPLVRSFELSKKPGKKARVDPIVDSATRVVRFETRTDQGVAREGSVSRAGAICLVCETPVPFTHVRSEGRAGRMGRQLMAMVAEGERGRIYFDPDEAHIEVADSADPSWRPESLLPQNPRDFKTPNYGMSTFGDLFTDRQLVAMTAFNDLIPEARDQAFKDAVEAGLSDDGIRLNDGGIGAAAYADAIQTYLALVADRVVERHSTICTWDSSPSKLQLRNTFARQAVPMTWDFAEGNPFCESSGSWAPSIEWVTRVISHVGFDVAEGEASQLDAVAAVNRLETCCISTDPPYYDNIGYADLSDFFYVWLRRSLNDVYPSLFSTLATPKEQELVATPYRFEGSKATAEKFFEQGLQRTFSAMKERHDSRFPMTVFYAFKQAETAAKDAENIVEAFASTGWETMLEGLLSSGFAITATWPMRSELSNRPIASGKNALASSIVLACRSRPVGAPLATRKEFAAALRSELPEALRVLQHGNIAPVDLAQAAIGPGMAVFSRYSKVIDAEGSSMRVRTALELINQVLTEVLSEQEDEFDSATRWAISWFEQYSMKEGPYGEAEVLARAKGVAVNGLVQDGVVLSGRGKVRLMTPDELAPNWDPMTDQRLRAWEVTHYLVRALTDGGEEAAAAILRKVGASFGDLARDLAYRLYNTCDRKKWAPEARGYNQLVLSWPEIQRLAGREAGPEQQTLG